MGQTIVSSDERFEWEEEKNKLNQEKHKICFEEVLSIFDSPTFITDYDSNHSENSEQRFSGIGIINGILVVTVFFTPRNNRTRIISARKATTFEKEVYYEHIKNFI